MIYERHAFFFFSTGSIARHYNIPLVVEVNELVGDDRVRKQPVLSGLARWCDQRLLSNASLIIVVSPYLKRELIVRHGIPESKIEVHCNAVDEEIARDDSAGFEGESSLVGREGCVFGFVGWFVDWHRLDLLIEVFSALCDKRPNSDFILLLVGDGPLRNELVNKCRQLGISDKVKFAGIVEHSRVPEILKGVDVAVIPHSNEYRSPVKLFEYMAAGCAVVAADTEPISMVIENGKNGFLFTPLDKEQMLKAFLDVALDRGLCCAIGRRAQYDVMQSYTWKHNALRVLKKLGDIGSQKV